MLRKFFKKAGQVVRDDQGITAVEYAILGALVALGITAASTSLGQAITGAFGRIVTAIGGGAG
ncbi:hypothetical protein P409_06875 [Inquilinus limosus MP06]|uniref:Pilus assembly protein n=2 Tax=Inquilinus limosus TaxID=171674 RepID=A0A0A0DAG8_9PROT|nr:hypothetical protein P409_06875 [Inquilinus limosus MP06]